MIRAWLSAAAILLAGAGALSAKTLVYCSEGDPNALNPQLVTTTTAMNAARPMFNNLVDFEKGSLRIVPSLAESWTVSPDGLTYRFNLRRDVRFHANARFTPTRAMNADDVVFSLERQWRADHPFHDVSGSTYDYFRDLGMPGLLDAVEKADEHTLVIRIKRPDATFLASLAMPLAVVLSAEYAEQLARAGRRELIDQEPVGTGPFTFDSYQRNVAIRYRAFDGYWGGRQPIDTLVFSITPNAAVRLTKLRAGECHVMAYPAPGDVAKLVNDPGLRVLTQEGLNVGYLALNVTRTPFDDVRVRRAVNMAVDKGAIIEAVYAGAGIVAKNPIPPLLWSYNDAVKDYAYDPDAAGRLLAEAGYPDGFETELWYMPVSRPYNPDGRRVAELVAADLLKVGIRLRLVTHDWDAYRARIMAGDAPMALFGWTGDNGDPDNFLDVLLGCTAARPGGNNIAKWCDRDYDALVTRAKVTNDGAAREALYARAQEIAKREAPWVPLAHSLVFMGIRRDVAGFDIDLLGRQIFDGVDLLPSR